MTALLVVEADRLDAVVTVDARSAAATGSRLGLRPGDRWRVADLLTAALVASANDACRALAQWHDGSEAKFVARMNRRAAALGLVRTHFVNACGHDAPGHVSSADDLARLAEVAMAQPAIAERVRHPTAQIADADGAHAVTLRNRNALVGRYPGAIGVKSGFTARARQVRDRDGGARWCARAARPAERPRSLVGRPRDPRPRVRASRGERCALTVAARGRCSSSRWCSRTRMPSVRASSSTIST